MNGRALRQQPRPRPPSYYLENTLNSTSTRKRQLVVPAPEDRESVFTAEMVRRTRESWRLHGPVPYRHTEPRSCRAERVKARALEAQAARERYRQPVPTPAAPEDGAWLASPLSRFARGIAVHERGAEHADTKTLRALRAAAMDVNRAIFGPSNKLSKCLRDPRPRKGGAPDEQGECFPRHVEGQGTVRAGELEGTVSVSGLVLCARPWVCPECRMAVLLHYGADIAIASIRAEVEYGWSSMFVTLTFPTEPGSPLKTEWGLLSKAWRKLITGGWWTGWCQRWGIEEWVATDEVNWRLVGPKAKWHPHCHLLLHSGAQLDEDQVERATWELTAQWRAIIMRLDATRLVDWQHGVTGVLADRAEDLGSYLTKLNIGHEMADAGTKVGHVDEVIPAPNLTSALAATGPAWSLMDRARSDWRLMAMVKGVAPV